MRQARTWPIITELVTSCVEGEGSPIEFYKRLGFMETGARGPTGERILRIALRQRLETGAQTP